MSIKDIEDKSKSQEDAYTEEEFDIVGKGEKATFAGYAKHFLVISIIILSVGVAFGVGRISQQENTLIPPEIKSSDVVLPFATVDQSTSVQTTKDISPALSTRSSNADQSSTTITDNTVVASKTGTKYYFPWCGNAKRILESNKVYYSSAAEARKAGLTPSNTCKGLP
jgi:hypothetical protein